MEKRKEITSRTVQLAVFEKTFEAHLEKVRKDIVERDAEWHVAVKPLEEFGRAVGDAIRQVREGGKLPDAFDIKFAVELANDDETYHVRETFWDLASGVEYSLFNDNSWTGLSRNVIHAHFRQEESGDRLDVTWTIQLNDIRRPCRTIYEWDRKLKYEKSVPLWEIDGDGLPIL